MNSPNLYEHPGWKWCTSEGAEMDSLLVGLKMTLPEKLKWLEEMETLTLISKTKNVIDGSKQSNNNAATPLLDS